MVVPGSIPKIIRSFSIIYAEAYITPIVPLDLRTFAGMIAIPDKAKHLLLLLAKLLVVGGAFYFIYRKLSEDSNLEYTLFAEVFERNWSVPGILLILLLTVANRFLEILKWQNLAKTIRPINLAEATQQVLAALTAALFTPNGIGEYAGKALFFRKNQAKEVIFLNLICNGVQMGWSILFGLAGLAIFNYHYIIMPWQHVGMIAGVIISVVWLMMIIKKITIKGYSLQLLFQKIGALPRQVHQKNIMLALLRYLVFSHQYYVLFVAFEVETPYLLLMTAISSVYLLASSLPSFQFLDFAVKGSVAVFFFGLMGINEWIVIFISMLMWILNVVLPVIIGSVYVIRYKPSMAT